MLSPGQAGVAAASGRHGHARVLDEHADLLVQREVLGGLLDRVQRRSGQGAGVPLQPPNAASASCIATRVRTSTWATECSLPGTRCWCTTSDGELQRSTVPSGHSRLNVVTGTGLLVVRPGPAELPCADPARARLRRCGGRVTTASRSGRPTKVARRRHGACLAGWFAHARAVVFGRTDAPDHPRMTQREAVLDALGRLDLPIVFDVEIGHVPPHLPLVNGALARLTVDGNRRELVQQLR